LVLASAPPFRRILVTAPPRAWFHGISYKLFEIYSQALRDLGCTLFEIPIERFWPLDLGHIATLLDDIREFAPELAIGLPNGSTALHCRLPAEQDGWRPHLFTDVLDLPTVCIWDHAPLELAAQLFTPVAEHPSQSLGGARAALRRTFTHPRLLHCPRDAGQIRIMRELGLVAGDAVVRLPAQALPGFAPPAEPVTAHGEPPVCFVGHIYQEPPAPLPDLETLARGIIAQWSDAPDVPLWDVANAAIAALGDDQRRRLALDADQTFFWHFMLRLIDHRAQTHRRLALLGASGTRVGFYGNLSSNAPNVPGNLVSLREDEIEFGPELARVFARHKIMIDVQSPGFIDGYSLKAINGFASGGFALIDRKRHFVSAFGDAGEAVSYSDGSDLAAKIDYFLSQPKQRVALAAEMRAQIADGHTLEQFFQSLLQAARDHFGRIGPPQPFAMGEAATETRRVHDLLRSLITRAYWLDAEVDHAESSARVTTSSQAWSYAAELPIPPPPEDESHERILQITLKVEAGRLGIALFANDDLSGEQLVSPTRSPVTVTINLPEIGEFTVILRNTVDGPTQATILTATLRE
jgi:Glycosyl transferases group 1